MRDKDTNRRPSIKDHKVPKQHVPTMKETIDFNEAFGQLVDESMSAFDMVKKSLKDKGALIDTSKTKPRGMFDVSPEEAKRRNKNWLANQKGENPYKARPGESD